MFNTIELQKKIFELTSATKFLIAYSGGMDSHVLLHAMSTLTKHNLSWILRAAHINHGLSPNAHTWEQHCRHVCNNLGVPYITQDITIDLKNHTGHSMESLARDLRYQALTQILAQDEILLTAQHNDDQIETLLLQLFRGAGPKGLAAMPSSKKFAASYLCRPLLNFSRNELKQYAIEHTLQWVEDESNENTGIDRNFVRHSLIPLIKQRWPGIAATIQRTTSNCAQADELTTILAEQDYQNVTGSVANTISIKKLLNLSESRQNNVLRHWLQESNHALPSNTKLQHIKKNVMQCSNDANPIITWKNVEVRRYRDNLYALTTSKINIPTFELEWNGESTLILPYDLGIITPNDIINFKGNNRLFTVYVGYKKNRCKIYNRTHSYKIKNIFQEYGIPHWMRNKIPLVFQGEELVAVIFKPNLS